ncbi:MAG: type II toxin-antitoxin system RelE/ParE family toxin [Sulfuricurvum sp.]|nr:type II toxin-antitoxin system RelE/ParE family toxin [Sulfuricurvum sp.]MDD5387171.1 type II toxin-antitoxin system RelE/ParE family toxin [Sulfuricurvum sp.]
MYKVAFNKEAEKEFLKLEKTVQELITKKILDLQDGIFTSDKALKGNHKGKFRKRAGDYRIVYLKENNILVITLIRIAHRKEVY